MSNSNRTPEEQALMTKAAAVLPGGSLGNLRLDEEHAFVVREGHGSRVIDVSGNEYIDYLLGSGPMLLGHAHAAVDRCRSPRPSRTAAITFFAGRTTTLC